jgi:protein-disulfide isomerase
MQNNLRPQLITIALALVFGFIGAALWSVSGLADARTKTYLLDNPQLLPQMAEAYQAQQSAERLAGISAEVMTPFEGAVLGNPNGSRVLVEFTDYNCPYCKMSQADLARLIESDPELKVVVREWPIFQGSDAASRMALAAAMQGRYTEFHEALFELSPATPEAIEEAAKIAGLDLAKAQQDAMSEEVELELRRNMALASQIGFTGTPSWVTKDRAFEGAVGYQALKDAIEAGDS